MPANQTLLQSQSQTLMPIPPGIQPLEPAYQTTPSGGSYAGQQFQPPPQHDPHHIAPPLRYDSPSQQGGYYPTEQPYAVSTTSKQHESRTLFIGVHQKASC
jgi:hypothetical protein